MATPMNSELRLNEAEIAAACNFAGWWAQYDEPYDSIGNDSQVTFWTDGNEYRPKQAVRVSLGAVASGTVGLEEVAGDPPSKIFEAIVLRSTTEEMYFAIGKELVGALFPNGTANILFSGPEDDFTFRLIEAGHILKDKPDET